MLNLTKQERQVVLFLISAALVGIGLNFWLKTNLEIKVIGYLTQDIGKINLNAATKDTLMDIKGIGDKLAQRIIMYREQNGDFKDIEELKNIKGIGVSKYEAIKENFFVE